MTDNQKPDIENTHSKDIKAIQKMLTQGYGGQTLLTALKQHVPDEDVAKKIIAIAKKRNESKPYFNKIIPPSEDTKTGKRKISTKKALLITSGILLLLILSKPDDSRLYNKYKDQFVQEVEGGMETIPSRHIELADTYRKRYAEKHFLVIDDFVIYKRVRSVSEYPDNGDMRKYDVLSKTIAFGVLNTIIDLN